MLVFIKNSLQTRYEFCKKDFKSLGRRVWRCQARLLNRETSIDSIITTSISQLIVPSNNKTMSISLFNNDYDPHESGEKGHHYRCYWGIEFRILHGLNTHRRSCDSRNNDRWPTKKHIKGRYYTTQIEKRLGNNKWTF